MYTLINILKKVVLLLIICITVVSCDKDANCLKGNGNVVTETRTLGASFDYIYLNHNINLNIKQDSIASITVTGGSNLLSGIKTSVEGNTLRILSKNKCSYLKNYDNQITVNLSVPDLKGIEYLGFGDVKSVNTLNFPDFTFDSREGTGDVTMSMNSIHTYFKQHTGPADFNLSGYSKHSFVYTNGNGWFYAGNLISENTHVSSNGTGDVFVNATNTLKIELRSMANVNYYGDPVLNVTEHSGSGEIIKK